ncbi:MAG: hypothetical protein WCD76_14025 [Pyrinomonadaceae bacterium]
MNAKFRTIRLALTLATLVGLALGSRFGTTPVRGAVLPSVSSVTGAQWSYTCPNTFNNYLQVPYADRTDSGVPAITLTGKNLDTVYAVSIKATGYTAKIVSKSSTRLILDIRAGPPSETPKPAAAPELYLTHPNGVLVVTIKPGLIPALYVDTLAWNQCTWWAGGIRRIQTGRSVVNAYAKGLAISPDPSSSGFPRQGAVLMTYQKHMSYVESVAETGRTNYSDGSARITYQIVASQYNWPCGAGRTSKTATMVIQRSRLGSYSFITKPVVGYEITHVKQ